MRMYAQRNGPPLERAATRALHTKRTDQTLGDLFERVVTLGLPLNDEQRQKLLAIADRCPVDLMLVRGSEVKTRLAG
jgi:hypothetical protein